MEKHSRFIIFGLAGLLVGIAVGYAVGANGKVNTAMHQMPNGEMVADHGSSMDHAMDDIMMALQGKTGDAFDKAFLTEMIMHHEGAVVMSQAVLEKGKHEELKQLSKNIIAAQTTEIEQMKKWLKDWYGVTD